MECVGRPFDFGETLSRDWAGFRTELIRLGITPTASYVAQFLGNPSGGQSTGFTYAGTFELLVHWDIGKLLPVGGLSLVVGTGWSTGRSLSADEIGNIFAVQSAYTAVDGGTNSLTLGPLYLHQRLLDDRLMLAVGRLAPAETFATMPVLNNYVNGGISATPGSLETDIPSFAAYPPGMQWGAQAVYRLTPALQVEAGVFNASRRSAAGADGGADFSLGGDHTGVLSVVQATYLINRAGTSAGLPGLYSVGGMYDSSRFSRVSGSGGTTHGNAAVYAMFQQMVYREGGPGSDQGLTLWGEVAVAPRSSVSPLPLFVGGGVSYQGLIPGRGPDIASLGVISRRTQPRPSWYDGGDRDRDELPAHPSRRAVDHAGSAVHHPSGRSPSGGKRARARRSGDDQLLTVRGAARPRAPAAPWQGDTGRLSWTA